ncbi:MAG: RNA ligase partner protein [Nitrospirota bacterium]|jgi:RNA ligase partner protein
MAPARSNKDRVVLDTSLFVNPDVRASLGATPTEALEAFLFIAAQLPILEFYMPPSIFEELMNFVHRDEVPGDLLVYLHQKSPKRHELSVPALFIYELVEEIRDRVNKGLRIAEKAARSEKPASETVQELRRKYRDALREGIIDSKEDVDLLLLARELDALLVTADQGVIKWADKLGLRWLLPEKFRDYLMGSMKKAELHERK